MLVADEPISMLDMSVRAKILQLMLDLKHDLGLTYVYITHDLASAKYFCDRIAIMYLGRIVEIGADRGDLRQPPAPVHEGAAARRSPIPTRAGSLPRDLPRGEIPDAASRRSAARSTPAAPRRPRSVRLGVARPAGAGRGALDPPHPEEYDAETERRSATSTTSTSVGDRGHDRQRRTPTQTRALLDRMRAEDADEPFWTGVEAIEDDGDGRADRVPRRRGPGAAARRRRRRRLRALPRTGRLDAAPCTGTELERRRSGLDRHSGSGGGVPPQAGQIAWWAHQSHSRAGLGRQSPRLLRRA